MLHPTPRRSALVAVVLAAALAGCGADADVSAPPASVDFTAGDVPVVIPGSPGEPTQTVAPGETGSIENAGRWNEADVTFLTGMVPHHAQALEMAQLAEERAQDDRVRALADRIVAAQGPEIQAMQSWLESQGLPPADLEAAHDGMVGMASEEQLLQLVAADGEDFDALFLQLMTVHHEGALEMAAASTTAENPLVTAMIEDTVVSQSSEIARMQELLTELG